MKSRHGHPGPREEPGDGPPPPPAAPAPETPGAASPGGPAAPAAPSEAPPDAFAAGPDEALAAKTRECERLLDQLQRVAAEYSNYQKRMDQRLRDERRYGVRDLAVDLLPALDNLERVLAHAPAADPAVLVEAVRVARRELLAALARHGVTPIEAAGRPFDPHEHEAVAHLPSESHPPGVVMDEVRRGYRLGDWTIRASRVAVSSGPPAAQNDEG